MGALRAFFTKINPFFYLGIISKGRKLAFWIFKNKGKVTTLYKEMVEFKRIVSDVRKADSEGGKEITKAERIKVFREGQDVIETAIPLVELLLKFDL